jgi:hypothetical protein
MKRSSLVAAVVVWMAIGEYQAQMQEEQPVNTGANPYRVIRD